MNIFWDNTQKIRVFLFDVLEGLNIKMRFEGGHHRSSETCTVFKSIILMKLIIQMKKIKIREKNNLSHYIIDVTDYEFM